MGGEVTGAPQAHLVADKDLGVPVAQVSVSRGQVISVPHVFDEGPL